MSTKPLKKQFYFMSPVQVVKVTTHNIEQAAEWCGGEIKTTDSRRYPGRTDKYIDVPVPKGAALVMAFPGMFITKRVVITLENDIKVTFGVFRKDFFEKNYWSEPLQAVDACWTRLANEEVPVEQAIAHVSVANPGDVGKALMAAREKITSPHATVVDVIEAQAEIIDAVLTPAQQRMLITGNEVEAGVVPETANVVLPTESRHPSLRGDVHDPFKVMDVAVPHPIGDADAHAEMLRLQNTVGRYEDPRTEMQKALDKAAYDLRLKNPEKNDEDEAPGLMPSVMDPVDMPKTMEVLERAAEKIDRGSEAGGELDDSAVVGSASAHRTFLEGGIAAAVTDLEGRSSAQASADKAAYEAEMKEIQDGDPNQ